MAVRVYDKNLSLFVPICKENWIIFTYKQRYVRLQAFSLHIGKASPKTKKATLSGGFPCFLQHIQYSLKALSLPFPFGLAVTYSPTS